MLIALILSAIAGSVVFTKSYATSKSQRLNSL